MACVATVPAASLHLDSDSAEPSGTQLVTFFAAATGSSALLQRARPASMSHWPLKYRACVDKRLDSRPHNIKLQLPFTLNFVNSLPASEFRCSLKEHY